jgi:hypothetical protein
MASTIGICKLVDENFNIAHYSAEDGIWEVYNETSIKFLNAVSSIDNVSGKPKHETLDSFVIDAKNQIDAKVGKKKIKQIEREIEIIFNENMAVIKFSGPYEMESWFEHFVTDLKKHLRPPTFRQRINTETTVRDVKPIAYPKLILSSFSRFIGTGAFFNTLIEISKAPYCTIILHKKSPNALLENVKAGLVTNFIWVPIVFIFGILFTLLAYWIWNKYNLNIYELITPPAIPTRTPMP